MENKNINQTTPQTWKLNAVRSTVDTTCGTQVDCQVILSNYEYCACEGPSEPSCPATISLTHDCSATALVRQFPLSNTKK
jgi:hypothetical protein